MSGLGILMEEPSKLHDIHEFNESHNTSNQDGNEILLPPLPNENELNDTSSMSTSLRDDEAEKSSGRDSRSGSLPSEDLIKEESQSFFLNSNHSFSTYELDSPSINLDNNQLFPTISNSTTNSTEKSNTSPLKRLRTIKNSIRKLSLSKMSNSSNNNTASVPTSMSNTSIASLGPPLYTSNSTSTTSNSERPHVNPLQSHFKTSSQDSTTSANTTESKLKCITPTTPPFSSPVITLSDNLELSKETLQKIEQNYFESFQNGKQGENENQVTLTTHYNYLVNEREIINESYNLTKNRLIKSGWCSDDDLHNLSLQKTNQLKQINAKLNEINAKLSKINE